MSRANEIKKELQDSGQIGCEKLIERLSKRLASAENIHELQKERKDILKKKLMKRAS